MHLQLVARPGVGYKKRREEPSPPKGLQSYSRNAPAGVATGKGGDTGKGDDTGKLNGKRRHSGVDGAENVSAFKSTRYQNVPA